jgi:hypothetical protein
VADPRQQAENAIKAEQEAKAVAKALEALRKELDPTRQALQNTEKAAGGFRAVVSGLQSVASMGGQPAAAISAVGGQFGKLLSMAGPWGAAAGMFVETLSSLPQMFKSAGDSIAGYVGKLNPTAAARWTQAWDDMAAAIGGYLMPILENMTGVVRFFGDAIAGWQPIIQPIIDQAMRLAGSFGSAFGGVIDSLMEFSAVGVQVLVPFLQIMTDINAGPLRLVVIGLQAFSMWLHNVAQQLALFFGIDLPKFNGSSAGMAARSTGVSSVQAMLTNLQTRAFALGGSSGKGADPALQAANFLEKILGWIEKTLPAELKARAKEIVDAITTAAKQVPGQGAVGLASGAVNVQSGMNNAVENAKFGLRQLGSILMPRFAT